MMNRFINMFSNVFFPRWYLNSHESRYLEDTTSSEWQTSPFTIPDLTMPTYTTGIVYIECLSQEHIYYAV